MRQTKNKVSSIALGTENLREPVKHEDCDDATHSADDYVEHGNAQGGYEILLVVLNPIMTAT